MEVLEEKEEEERREEEELKALGVGDSHQDVETKASVEPVCVPSDLLDVDWSSSDTSQLPSSYKTNSLKEKKLLRIADHFLQQYAHLCPDRKLLFLCPANECGVEKFVSTTVRPTLLPYTELYRWDGCASFVSDYLTMEPLKSPITPPSSLYSPTTILKYQQGNCFDFSVLLCSMLIGAGYDAYCVHGYATREVCTLDETLELCPLLEKPPEVPKEERKKSSNKYKVKPPPDLQSKFELQQEAKKAAEGEAARKNKERGEEKVTGVEKPERDPLYGLRVHAWVLVLSGKREVPETFFINPFTGNSHSTTDEHFLGIESVWNHRNYWVNMQDCRNGCKDLTFDLGDTVRWEIMLLESNQPVQPLPDAEEEKELSDKETNDTQEKEEEDMSFDMPPSWVAPIQVSPREFETRYSQGKKVILYKKAKLEKWAPYLNENGLVKRLTVYADLDCTEAVEVREWFKNREDMLDMREVNKQTQLTTDYFRPGHLLSLKAHTYGSLEPETKRTMEFYNEARVDGLQKRVENATEMTEYFVGQDDFLHLRHVEFGKRGKKVHLAGTRTDVNSRPIVQIKECFHRNLEKPADEDVAERIFLITEEMIHLTYHLKDKYITASKDLFKVAEMNRKGNKMIMTPEMCITYQAGSSGKGKKLLHLYKLLQELMEEEKRVKQQVRQSEAEVLNILKIRENEETAVKLSVSIYNTERNEKRQQYEAMNTVEDDLLGQEEQDLDYLAPFLIQIGPREKMPKGQALRVRDDCLTDLKHCLVDKVNIIQARFEKAVEELQKKNQWFQENRNQLSAEEEADFLTRHSEATFHIHILSLRLNREKRTAPQKYLAVEERLRRDPRLAEHLSPPRFPCSFTPDAGNQC
ncbi:dynein regulatory complex subunit 7 isoform X3 [Opisthocomus hoazin]|uniref:dynein regulatory complex subunit 7 isoform X3 n=1 Tax=Opisthocomus hoazin TaxID=30419 RepID=UPI003F52DF90